MRSLIEQAASDPDTAPAQRRRALENIRRDLEDLQGQIDGYIGSSEAERESDYVAGRVDRIKSRQRADIREDMLRAGEGTPEALDELGYVSHEALDQAEEDGVVSSL